MQASREQFWLTGIKKLAKLPGSQIIINLANPLVLLSFEDLLCWYGEMGFPGLLAAF